ncbi:MAG: AI-2E family transporter [Desulfotomaculaceae bacterium]|nr:AI-2E family transporter [Desulfotomaculaceae bacterium]
MVKGLPRLIFFLLAIVLAVYFFYLLKGLMVSFILAAFLTYLLNPIVNAIERRGTPRSYAILLTYLALAFVVAGIFLHIVPRVLKQLYSLEATIPLYIAQTQQIIQSVQNHYIVLNIPDGVRQIIEQRVVILEEYVLQLVRNAVTVLIGLVGYVFKLLLAPVLAFYLLKDLDLISKKAVAWLPVNLRGEITGLFKQINQVLASFIRGYFLVAGIVSVLTVTSMALLGVDFALMLGLVAGVTELIPYFGPVIGAIPAIGLALLESKWLALKVAVVFIIIHQLEGNIISPKIMSDKVGLHPLLVIFSLLAGGELYGLLGMLLAIPCAAVLKVLLCFAYTKVNTSS